MTDSDERGRYVPMQRGSVGIQRAQRLPFDISRLSVTGLVIICELGDPVLENVRPTMTMTMTMTQYLRLSDESMIRLDMDRGVSSFKHGPGAVSWKRSAADVIEEVLNLVRRDDAAKPDSFPWEAYAEAAQLRGISVDAEALRDLPHTALLSHELATIYEF